MNLIKNTLMIVIPIIAIIGAGIFFVNTGIISTESIKFDTDIVNVTLKIDYSNDTIDTYNIKMSNPTVYSLLIKASNDYDFSVGRKYYDQYQSHYIFSINNVAEGENNKFWQYYINGNYGAVGADLQTLKDNDFIEWKFQEPKI